MFSSISVPLRSLTPQRSASVAASRPILTQLAWRLRTVLPRARRKTAVCLRFSSRLISSMPCVRPSSVWNGMKLSGTNSVKPPVRSWSSRTTRMCSASSHGSSTWPNMTGTDLRRPSAMLDGLSHPLTDVALVVLVGVRGAAALAEAAERAADGADVRGVDVAVDDEGDRLPRELGPQLVRGLAHVLDRLGARLGEQRGQLL